ncbi:hypothetical protein LJC49_09675 [Ruminococcaceae bacterium OttesenSCG-928-I18]|nr:hypothetical protein [Ruminococcaceae bacterium OttesenSCG-928-I18]
MDRLSDVNHYYADSPEGDVCTISRQWYEEAKDRLAAYEDLGTVEGLAARVEVVRCKDCKYRNAVECPTSVYQGVDENNRTKWFTGTIDDGWCYRGPRAEAEEARKKL